jgi:hypothetical protein
MNAPDSDLQLLPWPKRVSRRAGVWRLKAPLSLTLAPAARALETVAVATCSEIPIRRMPPRMVPGEGWFFQLGVAPPDPPALSPTAAFALHLSAGGAAARGRDYPSLVHAWMTLRQLFRKCSPALPLLTIADWPEIPWRVYHLDLKGTRRTLDRLYAILPELAEWRINAILAEYEDHLRLPSHPDIAAPDALTSEQVRSWVEEAGRFGITVIPLVQTLGHLQYLLSKSAYAHLREHPDDPAEACSSHPHTWPLIRDMVDDLLAIHPGTPFFHIGLDETFRVATCPRCVRARQGQPPVARFVEWARQVASYVLDKGPTPLMWADVLARHLDLSLLEALPRELVFCGWGYLETGPLHYQLGRYRNGLVSREWFRRPLVGRVDGLPPVPWTGGRWIEDLTEAERRILEPVARNPHYPQWVNSDFLQRLYRRLGLRHAVATGLRVSFHGPFHPLFITAQLNTLQGARACRRNGGLMLIGTSWSRGHSLAAANAHPDLDAYGLATLGTAGWGRLEERDLRIFDARFAFHQFGLSDETLGDLLFMAERSSPRADHVHRQYLPAVQDGLRALRDHVTRHRSLFDLLLAVVEARQLQFAMQFALLEMEYFSPRRAVIPQAVRDRIGRDVRRLAKKAARRQAALAHHYAKTLIRRDAEELAETQLAFTRAAMETVYTQWASLATLR